jgi:hypothetical protein
MRRRFLTYANVMSTTAVVIALTGGAYVAWAVERNSIESQHIVNGEVKNQDLDAGAVESGNIKNKEVKTNDLADDAEIANARAVDGSSIKQVSWKAPNNTTYQKLFSMRGLTVHAHCSDGMDRVTLRVRSNVDESILGIGALNAKTFGGSEGDAVMFPGVDNEFNQGDEEFIPIDDSVSVFTYGRGPDANPVVTGTFLANQWAGGGGECTVVGTVVGN